MSPVVVTECEGVKPDDDECQIRPRVGAGANHVIEINAFRVGRLPESATFDPAAPHGFTLEGGGQREQQQREHHQSAPYAAMDPQREAEIELGRVRTRG